VRAAILLGRIRGAGVGRANVFGTEAEADDAGGDAAEDGEASEEREWKREASDWRLEGERGTDETSVGEYL
jgi:hypothetical protein